MIKKGFRFRFSLFPIEIFVILFYKLSFQSSRYCFHEAYVCPGEVMCI